MRKLFILICLLAMLAPLASAMAADETSDFLTSGWRLYDGGVASWHDIINTTNKVVYVDVVFFDEWGDFCGCGSWYIDPYASLKFWTDDLYDCCFEGTCVIDNVDYCAYTTGQFKVVGYTSEPTPTSILVGGSVVGYTTILEWNVFDKIRNSSSMKALTENKSEMASLHKQCMKYWSSTSISSPAYSNANTVTSPLHGDD